MARANAVQAGFYAVRARIGFGHAQSGLSLNALLTWLPTKGLQVEYIGEKIRCCRCHTLP